ncbi:uncharacterized protein TRIADDRAFT_61943 [Trichoplax adhaerens]|uniref:NB-ARC domain-containing protein n=1 Tax=Trichoplax adhaerens TaxID=10228 RepID=B3SCE4_TRIAD|nr:predicted protein [Trichoplax adhaerens]EDV19577.1 predicted protein [Trichoplax adhaerens]|eukprot:XP_002117910.1 predicted protein [Trichoplax adhaerens]
MASPLTPSPSTEIPLRNLPPTPTSHYVVRKEIIDIICDQLKIIDKSSGHILVHGMAGSGKTISVCQSVKQAANMGWFKSNGYYWIKIGNITNSELFNQLKILGISLGMEWKPYIQSAGEICAGLSNYLKEDHYQYLTFAKKSIATSRFLFSEIELNHYCIHLPEKLTYDEAIELLALHRNDHDAQILRNNEVVKNVIESCAGLPLAINLIGGLQLQADEAWKEAMAIIADKSMQIQLANYSFNLYGTLELSANSLKNGKKELFQDLAVFKPADIPTEAISTLWNLSHQKTNSILMEMNNKSLLRYITGARCYCNIHDLMIDYLHRRINAQTSNQDGLRNLNNKLIDGYRTKCNGEWSTIPDDGYFYQNIIHHAIVAENDEYLENFMTDLNWMTRKIRSDKTIYKLACDLGNYINYKQKKEVLQQAWLEANDADVIQLLLWFDMTDSRTRQRAIQLARSAGNHSSNFIHWTIASYSTTATIEYTYDACKGFGKNEWDDHISLSRPQFDHLRIIVTENNKTPDCEILIKDYERCNIINRIRPPEPTMCITRIQISADGYSAAFQIFYEEWIVYNIDKKEQINFINSDEREQYRNIFSSLQFCPVIDKSYVIMTLSYDHRRVKIWEIKGSQILPANKEISCDYEIHTCRWIMAQNTSQILLWWRKYNRFYQESKLTESEKYMNKCQVEIWSLDPWLCQMSVTLPTIVYNKTTSDNYLATADIENGLALQYINYINNNGAFIILVYSFDGKYSNYSSVVGLLKVEDILDVNTYINEFSKHFQPIFYPTECIRNIFVSDNQQFIAISDKNTDGVIVLAVTKGRVQSYAILNPSDYNQATFIPGTSRLLVYDCRIKQRIYEYNLQGHNIHWQDIGFAKRVEKYGDLSHRPKNNVKIIDLSMAHINNIAVAAMLTKDDSDKCKLQVYDYEVKKRRRKLLYSMKNDYQRCFLYDDFQSAIVICFKGDESKTIITEIDNFLRMEDGPLHRELLNYSRPQCTNLLGIESRYRNIDNTLIFVIEFENDDGYKSMIIISIDLATADNLIYKSAWKPESPRKIYMDDNYLYLWQTEKHHDDDRYIDSIKCYKFGGNKQQTQLLQMDLFDKKKGLICKVNINANGNGRDPLIKYSPKYKEEDFFIAIWGEKDTNLIVCLI